MSSRFTHSPVLILFPLLLAACVPGDAEGGRVASGISYGGRTFNEPPGSVLGCEVAFCIDGGGCQACPGEPAGCTPYAGCAARQDSEMGAGEICSPDGCHPSGCFPAFCTAAGLCTVCDDGDPSTRDECINYAPSPCRHILIEAPDATLPTDAGGPGRMDAVLAAELPSEGDSAEAPDPISTGDTPAIPDASIPGDPGQAGEDASTPDCLAECLVTCQDDEACEKSRMGDFPVLPPGWAKGKKLHCDRGRHLGWLKGRHLGWLKMRDKGWDRDSDSAALSCEEACTETCAP